MLLTVVKPFWIKDYLFKFFLLVGLSFLFVIPQSDDLTDGINKQFFSEVDFLIQLIKGDLEDAVLKGEIPTRLAITGLTMYGLTPVEKAYFEESINQIFWENIAFNFQRVKEAFQLTLKRENGKILVFRGATDHTDYLKFAQTVGAEHYVDIFIYKLDKINSFEFYIHDAKNNEVIWKKKWYVRRGGSTFSYRFGWKSQFRNLTTGLDKFIAANYLSNLFAIRLIGLGEVGALVDPGIIYQYYSLFEQYDITFSFGVGPHLALNLLELAGVAALHIDLWVTVNTLAVIELPLNVVDPQKQDSLYTPQFLFSPNVGFAFGLKDSNFVAEAGLDVFNIAPYFFIGFKL